jgi:hypothetical protein
MLASNFRGPVMKKTEFTRHVEVITEPARKFSTRSSDETLLNTAQALDRAARGDRALVNHETVIKAERPDSSTSTYHHYHQWRHYAHYQRVVAGKKVTTQVSAVSGVGPGAAAAAFPGSISPPDMTKGQYGCLEDFNITNLRARRPSAGSISALRRASDASTSASSSMRKP